MKISVNWLKQYIPTTLTPEEISVALTATGLEVEGIETFETIKGGLRGLVVGEVLTCVKHPNADKLSLTTVNVGGETPSQVVCGAPNVAAGQKVIVALPGTTVYPLTGEPFEIKKSKIRGEASEGMICAEDEIGMGQSHAGILILPADVKVGTSVADYFKVENDYVLEIGLTPNRADAASHLGVARDLAAAIQTRDLVEKNPHPSKPVAKLPSLKNALYPASDVISVDVEDVVACPRYSGLTLTGVKVGESPDWLKNRLRSIGVGPINNVVDITNYVLHECGQPLHAFDAAKIAGKKVIVRKGKEGEKFVTLDGAERILNSSNLVIADAEKAMCIAGVFGGIDSGITEATESVFLESAYFLPASIRKTSKQFGLKTDASFRFERGTDPEMTLYALNRAATLICEIAGGQVASRVTDIYPAKIAPAEFDIRYSYIDNFIGEVIDRSVIRAILESLGIEIVSAKDDSLSLRVPTFKVDVMRPVDVVEEILRIYGYDRIPMPKKQSISLPAVVEFDVEKLQAKIADYLAAQGFNEILTNSLTKAEYTQHKPWTKENSVNLLNPLSQELGVMRQDLMMTGLEAIQYNRNRRQLDLKFFEFGKVYSKNENGYQESYQIGLFLTGKNEDVSWKGASAPLDFYKLKSIVHNVLELCGIQTKNLVADELKHEQFAYGISVSIGTKKIVEFGALKPSTLRHFDVKDDVFHAILHWDNILRKARKEPVKYAEVSKFPGVKRDLSMMIDRATPFAKIQEIAYKTERKLLRDVVLFDLYQGDKIEKGKKSIAISFMMQDDTQTLTDKQIDKAMEKLMLAYENEVGAVIRKA